MNSGTLRFRIGTYNVLDPGFGTVAPWGERRENVARTITGAACGILCLQEIGLTKLARELDLLGDLAALTRMTRSKVSRDGVGFLYSAAWAAGRAGTFRLPRPRGDNHRSGVWQEFDHRESGVRVLAVSTHFSPWRDHDDARVRHARVLARRIHRINRSRLPVIIAGDFNSWDADAPATPMTELAAAGFRDVLLDTPDDSPGLSTIVNRSHGRRLDHIAVSAGVTVTRTHIENPDLGGPASDHRLVWADVETL